ncbi:Uncharacterized protein Rs2_38898 [Raphanus sativus]|nr:Uncharacterized protein Rs2_38898 [Raphanus sativus]
MLLLQRWEPINSNKFPNLIPFWITVHGLPLHHWTLGALHAIGKELGPILSEDVPKGRIRVHINGLKCLEMQLPVQLDSGEIMQVDLEYEKLEKHCFLCYSLCHEMENCPKNSQVEKSATSALGISQRNTLRNIEERRRQMEASKSQSRSLGRSSLPRDHHLDSHRSAHSRLGPHSLGGYHNRVHSYDPATRDQSNRHSVDSNIGSQGAQLRDTHSAHRAVTHERNQRPPTRMEYRVVSPSRRSGNQGGSMFRANNSNVSSRTPPPAPRREPMLAPSNTDRGEVNSHSAGRRSIRERLELPPNQVELEPQIPSAERRSALERLEAPPGFDQSRNGGLSNSMIARLQDVEVRYEDETSQNQVITVEDSVRPHVTQRLGGVESSIPVEEI